MSLKAILAMAMLYNRYRNEIISIKPPAFLFGLPGFVGKLVGIDYRKNVPVDVSKANN